MADHLEFGRQAEEKAYEWFTRRFQAKLIARNYRCKVGELDLIFELPHELVFVEVRARREGSMQIGIESVGPKKLQRLRKAIDYFLQRYQGPALGMRMDVLAWDGERWSHYPNIWF